MKKCKNCGAKILKNTDVCEKCGETYEYISLDPDSQETIQVVKPSNMLNVCILILSIIIFAYSLALIYLNFTNKKVVKAKPAPPQSSSEVDPNLSSAAPDDDAVYYYAVDLIGKTRKDLVDLFGEQYSIKLAETTQLSYADYPLVFSTLDQTLTDESVISSITVTGSGVITPEVTADMTYSQLSSALNFAKPAPILNEADSFYYAYRNFENDNYSVKASFKFDDDTIDKAPLSVYLECEALTAPKVFGTVTGLDEGSTLNVRQETLYESTSLHQLVEGDVVEILETVMTDDDTIKWYKVSFNGIEGYSSADYITINQ